MLKYIVCLWLLSAPAWAAKMLEVNYLDQEPGVPASPMRILLTDRYMRIDNGHNDDDYLLMDRKARRISNVTHDRREILQIDAGVVSMTKPARWQVREEIKALPNRGTGAKQVKVYVNDALCLEVTAMEGFLPDAAAALRTYSNILADVQAQTFLATPPELQNDCDLAQNVFEYQREVEHGLPVEESFQNGKTRRMLGYRTRDIEAQLFTLPAQYRTLNMKDIRGNGGPK